MFEQDSPARRRATNLPNVSTNFSSLHFRSKIAVQKRKDWLVSLRANSRDYLFNIGFRKLGLENHRLIDTCLRSSPLRHESKPMCAHRSSFRNPRSAIPTLTFPHIFDLNIDTFVPKRQPNRRNGIEAFAGRPGLFNRPDLPAKIRERTLAQFFFFIPAQTD